MSYGVAAALQSALFQRLSTDAALSALVGGDIYDAIPPGQIPALYVHLGPERVRDASDVLDGGATHDFTVAVVTNKAGFADAKTAAGAISDALVDADLTLSRGRLVGLRFVKAQAKRDGAERRRIDLTFRARVEDS